LRAVDWEAFSVARLRANARRFSTARFKRRLTTEIGRVVAAAAQPAEPSALPVPRGFRASDAVRRRGGRSGRHAPRALDGVRR
jgi:hypothetical protein